MTTSASSTVTMLPSVLDEALRLASLHLATFPLATRSKIPLPGSHGVDDATNDPSRVRASFVGLEDPNLAIACGAESGVFVLDVDPRSGGDASLGALVEQHGPLPRTWHAETGRGDGGSHRFFRLPPGFELRGKLAPGCDLKGEGGYVVAPPSVHPDTGKPYRWLVAPSECPLADAPPWLLELARRPPYVAPPALPVAQGVASRASAYVARMPPAVSGQGGHEATWNVARKLVQDFGLTDSDAWSVLLEFNARCQPPWSERELRHKLTSARQRARVSKPIEERPFTPRRLAPPRSVDDAPPPEAFDAPEADEEALDADADIPSDEELVAGQSLRTDAANADAVFAEYKFGTFRFVTEWEMWIAWDGKRWSMSGGKAGSRDAVVRAAVRVARLRFMHAMQRSRDLETRLATLTEGTPEHELVETQLKSANKLVKWLEQSQNASRANACVLLLQGLLGVSMVLLDTDPWLFNVRNGTINLRTGELRDHDRSDLITQLSDVEFDERARCRNWLAFVDKSMGGNTKLALYLQRVVGYQMTGSIREQVLIFHYGEGSNGKSTFRNTVQALLSEYAAAAPRGLLLASKGPPAHPAEIARLYGKRFAACAEVGESDAFDEAKVKDLTGGDTIACRRMNENYWDLKPTHKLDLYGNHKPTIRGTDNGIWRRISLIPWLVTVAKEDQDRELGDRLRGELSGILNWALAGCLEWQRIGLCEPDEVKEAVGVYRSESDVLGAFLRDHCVFSPTDRCARKDLRKRYETWCEELGHRPVGAKKLAERLRSLGVEERNVRRDGRFVDGWAGVRLKSDTEQATDGWDDAMPGATARTSTTNTSEIRQ